MASRYEALYQDLVGSGDCPSRSVLAIDGMVDVSRAGPIAGLQVG